MKALQVEHVNLQLSSLRGCRPLVLIFCIFKTSASFGFFIFYFEIDLFLLLFQYIANHHVTYQSTDLSSIFFQRKHQENSSVSRVSIC